MKHIVNSTDFKLKNSVITLGKFDGMHIGHQHLISQVISYKNQGYNAVMFSFSYHPGNLLSNKEVKLIYTEEEKLQKIKSAGIDILISYPFTKETMMMEPEDFIKNVLIDNIDAKVIVVGEDFRFGYKRKGDINLLKQLEEKYEFKTIVCKKLKLDDTVVSSSMIRSKLMNGDIRKVNAMLGQVYSIQGEVRHGRKIGRTLGTPTTNIIPASDKLMPASGVYVSKTIIDEKSHFSVTNIGMKPTVGQENKKTVETYIIDFKKDLYGKNIVVELYDYLRAEVKFDSLDELKSAMEKDIESGKKYFFAN